MKIKNIRKGIFETNSSSVHVLCINKNSKVIVPTSFTFESSGQFGWEYETYTDEYSAGEYLYQAIEDVAHVIGNKKWRNSEECENLMKKYGIYNVPYNDISKEQYTKYWVEEKPIRAQYINNVINEYRYKIENILHEYGCKTVIWQPSDKESYIDHGEDLREFVDDLIECPELLINFLFGKHIIMTGNDNDDTEQPEVSQIYDYIFNK